MSKSHSTVSRRDFMKGIGLGAAGIGAAAATAPVFHDMDELTASGIEVKQPWWVKQVDNPTTEIDWQLMSRFDQQESAFVDGVIKEVGAEEYARINAASSARSAQWVKENKPGYNLRANALQTGVSRTRNKTSFLGLQTATTPEARGVPKWQGTPEENSRMIRAAARCLGATTVGFVELNPSTTRKMIFTFDPDRKALEFEEIDQAYETDTKRAIPNKCKYVILFTNQVGRDMQRAHFDEDGGSSTLGDVTRNEVYCRGFHTEAILQEFLRGLGYQGLGQIGNNGLGAKVALGGMAGLGEFGRYNQMIFPVHGTLMRIWMVITDMPLAPTKPIDAGMNRFCYTCKKCADFCPSDSLSLEDDPTFDIWGSWNMIGAKRWQYNGVTCRILWRQVASDCLICIGKCVFQKERQAGIHKIVEGTIATTSLFNGFFRIMDDAFGYGKPMDIEGWWDLDLPPFGYDTMRGFGR